MHPNTARTWRWPDDGYLDQVVKGRDASKVRLVMEQRLCERTKPANEIPPHF
jgi:hypothetical protein